MIFVFGSNKAGIHGAGAALYAHHHYGAEWGVGEGLTGESYALPTLDGNLNKMPLDELYKSIKRFCEHAKNNPDLEYMLTPIGTGLAGYSMDTVKAMLKKCGIPKNVYLHNNWIMDDKSINT